MSYYNEGFKHGRLDAMNGMRLMTSLNSHLPGYAAGYAEGQRAFYLGK